MRAYIEVPELTDLVGRRASDDDKGAKCADELTITAINFMEGDEIQEGEAFALASNRFRAVEIVSPASGVIVTVLCEEDDVVETDETVAVVDADE